MTKSMNAPRPHSKLDLERELEWRMCRQDAWYFIHRYVRVLVVGKGYKKLDIWPHQEEIARWMQTKHSDVETHSGALKARQIGWTTIGNAFALWSMFFHENHPWIQVSVGEEEAQAALETKITSPYSMLPAWMRKRGPKVTTDTKSEFGFDNGSSMLAIPSTSRSGRSRAMYGCLFDEAAFMVDANEVYAGVEPMVYGPMFVFSTANGMGNMFHGTWTESLAPDSEWDMQFYPWNVVPNRTQEWYDRKLLAYRGKEHLFYQEYPSTPSEAFMRSGRTAFDMEHLDLSQEWIDPLFRIDAVLFDFHRLDDLDEAVAACSIPVGESRDVELHVWEEPRVERDDNGVVTRKPNYGIGVDVAEGLIHGDYSAVSVRNINTGETVATLRAHAPIYDLGAIVETIGYWYHTALIGVERNNFGLVPLEYLQNAGYPRLYRMDSIAEMKRGSRTPRYGWLTSRTTKPKMVQDLAFAVASDPPTVRLHDSRWLQEASTFVSSGTGRYAASPPNTDDLMMAELIAHQMELDIGEYPIIWIDSEPGPTTFGDIFTSMPYAEGGLSDDSLLNQPIGQPARDPQVVKSFTIQIRGDRNVG